MAAPETKSRRRSAANSGSQPPEPIVFFLDRSLGKKVIAQALRDAREAVEVHDDHFAPDATDEDWLVEVGRKRWVVLTKDERIRYRATERAALRKNRVRAFVLVSGNIQGKEMAQAFLRALPRMKRLVIRRRAPFIAKVTRSGNVSVL